MTPRTKRTTIYLDPDLHKALHLKAATAFRSVSNIVNDAVREFILEDAEDIAAFEARAKEPLVSHDEMIKRLN